MEADPDTINVASDSGEGRRAERLRRK
ncbi:hypothetical protein CGRA01v4_13216 [Colletotrichum graminicola]|nr:hypothetical protein CGRA01v4_13216 [Colletotrichum graminicola]